MKILAVDTSLSDCSCCVLDTSTRHSVVEQQTIGRGHAELLMPMIERVLASTDTALDEIDRFAATVGPGSFTGIRVGVSAVRALAMVCGKSAVGVLTLDALARQARRRARHPGPIVALLDARRGEFYVRTYDEAGLPTSEAALASTDTWSLSPPPLNASIIGTGAALLSETAASQSIFSVAAPDILDVAELAADHAEELLPPDPVYIRPPDAKPQRSQVEVAP